MEIGRNEKGEERLRVLGIGETINRFQEAGNESDDNERIKRLLKNAYFWKIANKY